MEKKKRILVVEDEVLIAQFLKMELELNDFEVCDYVGSGEEAILEAKELQPDLILMDIHLSGKLDGIETATEILKEKKIPIIFCTGYPNNELLERTKKINPLGYLRKPVIVDEVISIINSSF